MSNMKINGQCITVKTCVTIQRMNTEGGNKKQGRWKLRLKTVLRWAKTNAKCGKISERREKDLINVELGQEDF